jgi:thiopeptide-type bacteriocin biosynthesis protein
VQDTFAAEFHADTNFQRQLGARFRSERKRLEALLGWTTGTDEAQAGLEVFRQRSERLSPVVAALKACARAGQLALPLTALAPSYLHMHANRLLRSAHRAQELILYDFLSRLYESQAVRTPGELQP